MSEERTLSVEAAVVLGETVETLRGDRFDAAGLAAARKLDECEGFEGDDVEAFSLGAKESESPPGSADDKSRVLDEVFGDEVLPGGNGNDGTSRLPEAGVPGVSGAGKSECWPSDFSGKVVLTGGLPPA